MSQETNILVIDDEPDNFDVIEGLLYKYGYQLFYASHGVQALAQLKNFQPDLILLDVMMPELDGIEVCKIIKADEKYNSIPIIMVTALTQKEDLAQCLEAGADDFISKPVNSLELAARVKSMLRIKSQYDSLNKLLKFREDLVNIIIHDFRNPLTNIILCASLLKMPQITAEMSSEKIDAILASSETLKNQINNLLEIAKIQSGELVLNLIYTNLNSLCENILKSFELIANSQNINLISQLPQEVIETKIDPKILRHIIENLLSNALKFSEPNSKIILELTEDNSPKIYLKVIDFGVGISDTDKLNIFQKFYVGSTPKKVSQIGLGLSFCKMAIEAHGGKIKVEDNPQKGSIFTIELPQNR